MKNLKTLLREIKQGLTKQRDLQTAWIIKTHYWIAILPIQYINSVQSP